MKNIFLESDCIKGEKVYIQGEYYHYLKNVRRLRKGSRVSSVIGSKKYLLEIEAIEKDSIICKWLQVGEAANKPEIILNVYQAIIKPPGMDYIISRLSEIGVSTLIPFYTSRTIPYPLHGKARLERWKRLVRESCKVTGFESKMIVYEPVELDRALDILEGSGKVFLFSTEGGCTHLKKVLETLGLTKNMEFHLFFGPEGGFSEQEIKKIIKAGAKPVTLGDFIMRSETAALVGAGFIRVYYGECLNEKRENTQYTL